MTEDLTVAFVVDTRVLYKVVRLNHELQFTQFGIKIAVKLTLPPIVCVRNTN